MTSKLNQEIPPDLLKGIIGVGVRATMTPLITWAAAKGWFDLSQQKEIVLVVTAATAHFLWGSRKQYKDYFYRLVALRMPANATDAQIKAHARAFKNLEEIRPTDPNANP